VADRRSWRLGVRRILTVVAATALVALLTAALAGATGNRAKLQLRRTGLGTILVNGRGFTVYVFTRDGRSKDNCVAVSGCPSVWPPVTTSGKAVAGRGVSSRLIGTIALKSGLKQVTYAGHPLYTYVADSGPGQTFYVDVSEFGGRWLAVNATGNRVK
jgi:predicted lipoprotein with Yx(FWY)xxD motif